jgi:hypothetical protein
MGYTVLFGLCGALVLRLTGAVFRTRPAEPAPEAPSDAAAEGPGLPEPVAEGAAGG